MQIHPSKLRLPATLLGGLLLVSCNEVCDKDDKPQYRFTAEQRNWANPYVQGTTWRFRNATGYERSYLIKEFKDEMTGSGGGKSSLCPSYYHQSLNVRVERTDSVQATKHQLEMFTAAYTRDSQFGAGLFWGNSQFLLPIREIEEGTSHNSNNIVTMSRVLSQLSVSGRVYQNVVECTLMPSAAADKAPSAVLRIFMTKADGIIRFETKAGTAWGRV